MVLRFLHKNNQQQKKLHDLSPGVPDVRGVQGELLRAPAGCRRLQLTVRHVSLALEMKNAKKNIDTLIFFLSHSFLIKLPAAHALNTSILTH